MMNPRTPPACENPSPRWYASKPKPAWTLSATANSAKTGNWAWYVHQRISGFTHRPATPEEVKDPLATMSMGRDFAAFPEFYAEYFPTQGLRVRPGNITSVCTGPIRYIGQAQVQRDIANLKAAVGKVKVEDAFLPVVAPASAFPFYKNEYYKDEQSLLFALAEALREEYKAVLDAGLRVQIDDAFLPWTYERIVPPMTYEAVSRIGPNYVSMH